MLARTLSMLLMTPSRRLTTPAASARALGSLQPLLLRGRRLLQPPPPQPLTRRWLRSGNENPWPEPKKVHVSVRPHHLGGVLLDGDLDISQLLALIKPLEPRRVGGDDLSGPGLGDEGWDGSMSFNTYDDYKTPYGTFTIHDYHEEGWMRGKSIYSPDKPRTEIMSKIVEIMKASGRYKMDS